MEQQKLQEAIGRIRSMEFCFDTLQEAVRKDPDALGKDTSLKTKLRKLLQYYESGQWLRDYELDEQGLIPRTLKRGVLAQDSLYDFLNQMEK